LLRSINSSSSRQDWINQFRKRVVLFLKQSAFVGWLSLSNLLESIDLSNDCVQSILFKLPNNQQSLKLSKINVEGLKDLTSLLSVIKQFSILVQTGTCPSLHMAYIAINKLERQLTGTDVDENGDAITIDDRHEGDYHTLVERNILYDLFSFRDGFFSYTFTPTAANSVYI
jgi:hypothetical protein